MIYLYLSFATYHLPPLGLYAAMSKKQRKRESKIGPDDFPLPWPCSLLNETPWNFLFIVPINILSFFPWGGKSKRDSRQKKHIVFTILLKILSSFFLHIYT